MLIKLQNAADQNFFYVRADIVMSINRHPRNILETVLSTSVMTQNGPVSYVVLDSIDTIAEQINQALGFPNNRSESGVLLE